jgi:hypothetical protein
LNGAKRLRFAPFIQASSLGQLDEFEVFFEIKAPMFEANCSANVCSPTFAQRWFKIVL